MNKITTQQEYEDALAKVEKLMDAKEGTPELDELNILTNSIVEYEDIVFKDDFPIHTSEEIKEFIKEQNL